MPARAAECLSLHESAQERRLDGRLLEAREMLRSCATAECPTMVHSDCAGMLADVERLLPTVVFELSNGDLDPGAVTVAVEGDPRDLGFGVPFEFDPGSFTVLASAAGHEPWSEALVLREGEKNRLVPIRLSLPAPSESASAVDARPERRAPFAPPVAEPSNRRTFAYALGGVAVAALATSVWFATSALDRRDQAREHCAPLCSERDREAIESDLLYADVAGGTAIVALGLSVTALITDEAGDGTTTRAPPIARGWFASIGGSFR